MTLRARTAWMRTAYGFAWLRDNTLSPAAESFRQAVKVVEQEIVAAEERANGAAVAQTRLPDRWARSRSGAPRASR